MNWWVNNIYNDPEQGLPTLVMWTVWVIGSITLHELGHGWAAIRQGDRTPILTGHMTWNPVVHMGWQSLVIFAVLGIAWGAMPVDPTRFKSKYGDFIVSFAGPVMNISLAVVSIVIAGVWLGVWGPGDHPEYVWRVAEFFWWGVALNVVLVMLNLLPIPPLDGSRMLADVWPAYRQWMMHPQAAIGGLVLFVMVFFVGADYLWMAGFSAANESIGAIARLFAGP